ncbi:alpha/beta fold hydrolase [Nonomuraea sp. SYSU D8015]|uniref:alpha/beta fold hydrolase n=1 Tax=Nonomuraea sp. SYSU D8015 TaxID=2593644 RepID=UPI001CB700FC|nr:alpha/beta fold hydrolase [Nonomuraea sp. SYSU D8015]
MEVWSRARPPPGWIMSVIYSSSQAFFPKPGRAWPRSVTARPLPILTWGRTERSGSAVLSAPVTAAAWKEIPSTYVVCAGDRGTPPDVQRVQAGRAGRTIELQADHHPFLSQPAAAVADLIRDLMP